MPSGTVTPAGGGGGSTPIVGVLAYLAANHVVNDGSTIPWDSTLFDTGGYLNAGTGKFSIPASKLGIWRVEVNMYASTSLANLALQCYFDGPLTDLLLINMPNNANNSPAASGAVLLNVPSADVWDMTLLTGGAGATVVGGLGGSRVALTYLGAKP